MGYVSQVGGGTSGTLPQGQPLTPGPAPRSAGGVAGCILVPTPSPGVLKATTGLALPIQVAEKNSEIKEQGSEPRFTSVS